MHVIQLPYHLDEFLPDLDVPLPPDEVVTAELGGGDVWERLGALYSLAAQAVADAASDGARPVVVLSGDCTTALGIMAGLQRAGADPGIVWFDAHGDVQTLETTTSGYLGGLPLRLLTGYRPELIAARLGLRPVPEQRVVLVGARDLDPPEVTYLAAAAIRRTCTSTWTWPTRAGCRACAIPRPAARARRRSRTRCGCCSAPAGSLPSVSPAPGIPVMARRRSSALTCGPRSPAPDRNRSRAAGGPPRQWAVQPPSTDRMAPVM
jgi:Arginase family